MGVHLSQVLKEVTAKKQWKYLEENILRRGRSTPKGPETSQRVVELCNGGCWRAWAEEWPYLIFLLTSILATIFTKHRMLGSDRCNEENNSKISVFFLSLSRVGILIWSRVLKIGIKNTTALTYHLIYVKHKMLFSAKLSKIYIFSTCVCFFILYS